MRPPEVVLVRHGETDWSRTGRHTGRTDVPLNAEGQLAASRLQPILAAMSFEMVFCSPLQRARETCERAGFGAGMTTIEPDLMEWDYGDYEGLTSAQIHKDKPDWLVFRDGCPGGESPQAIGDRADRVIQLLRHREGSSALFAHGHLLRVLAARWLDLPPSFGAQLLLETAAVSVLSFYQDLPAIRIWNAPATALGVSRLSSQLPAATK
jgi:broad specificity phosphatase PhoE